MKRETFSLWALEESDDGARRWLFIGGDPEEEIHVGDVPAATQRVLNNRMLRRREAGSP